MQTLFMFNITACAQPGLVSNDFNYTLTTSTTGVYEITSISDNLCSAGYQGSTEITEYPEISINLLYDNVVCEYDSTTIEASFAGGQNDGYEFQWMDVNGVTYSDNPLTLAAESENILLDIHTNDGCEIMYSENAFIEVQSTPQPNFFVDVDSICINAPIAFYRADSDDVVNCLWSFDDGNSINECSSTSYGFSYPGFHNVTLTTETSAGCQNSISLDSLFYVVPDPAAEFDFEGEEGTILSPQFNFDNESYSSETYLWEFGDGYTSEELSPSHLYPADLEEIYTACLIAYNSLGCSDTICKSIEMAPDFLINIPNSFTPDGDGINDLFRPVLNDMDLADYSFEIYDRGGRKVFQTNDIHQSWNGSNMRNRDYFCPDGAYMYQIVTRENGSTETQSFQGVVILLR